MFMFIVDMIFVWGVGRAIVNFFINVLELREAQEAKVNSVFNTVFVLFLFFCIYRAVQLGMF